MKKRSVKVSGHDTSISLEDAFWEALHEVAARGGLSINALVSEIDEAYEGYNLSSGIRLYILHDLQERLDNALTDNALT